MLQAPLFILGSLLSSAQVGATELTHVPVEQAVDVMAVEADFSDDATFDGPDAAASCASGWVPCGSSHCIPSGNVCCASAGHEELYCPSGQTCTTAGTCTTGGSGGGGGCGSGQKSCGNYCIPVDGQCCNTSAGTYCASGRVCSADGQSCISTGGTGGGGGGGYCSNGAATQASCGGDTCGCADSCSSDSQCASGCCASGYCSPACVCGGLGTLTVNCGGGGGGDDYYVDDPYGRQGCSASSGGAGAGLLLLNMGVLLLVLRRKGKA